MRITRFPLQRMSPAATAALAA